MTERAPIRVARAGRAVAIRAIAGKELREVARDGRFWLVGFSVVLLLVTALAFGLRQHSTFRAEREEAQAVAETQWRQQDDKNPHAAAHYGTYVFKPASALSFLDPGVDPFVGVAIKLEAHRRNALEGAPAQDGTALQRFGRMSMASVLQLLVPLLVIGLGFGAFCGERERGTLRQLASLGVHPRALLSGKALGLSAALGLLLGPAIAIGAGVVWLLSAEQAGGPAPGTALRSVLLAALYACYFAAFLGVTLWSSAKAASSRAALVGLLGFWFASALVVPRVAVDAAALIAPAPSHARVAQDVHASLATGLPGGPAREERVEALSEELLERYGFKDAELVMDASLLAGIELQAEAAFESEVLDHHFARLERAVERQQQVVQWAALVSPFVAMQQLSMTLAGTDHAHHRAFADAAERYRRELVESLNRAFAEAGGAAAFDYRAGRELWARAPRFAYEQPGALFALQQQAVSAALLLGWLLLSGLLATRAVARMPVY